MASKKRICIIGGGPCGLLAIQHLTKVDRTGQDIVCFEKQSTYGGLWNFTWRIGTDEYGEPCHNSMYKDLWNNSPKEVNEIPQYTYQEHYGHAIPSFVRRQVIRDYLTGFCEKFCLEQFIKFNTVVRFVKYDEDTDTFYVTVCDLQKEKTYDELFTHVIVANGVFSTPYSPDIPGIETFPGLLMHSHDLRDFNIVRDKSVLSIGAGLSSVDVALMGMKYYAKEVTIVYHKHPLPLKWPTGVRQRPQIVRIESGTVHFSDGGTMVPDIIIVSTGYKCHFPFMDNDLRLRTKLSLYPENLYKAMLFTKGGNNKVFYMDVIRQFFGFSWFNLQAMWIVREIHRPLANKSTPRGQMEKDMEKWSQKLSLLQAGFNPMIKFMGEYASDLCTALQVDDRPYKASTKIMFKHVERIMSDPMTCRDYSYMSVITGVSAIDRKVPWIEDRRDNDEFHLDL